MEYDEATALVHERAYAKVMKLSPEAFDALLKEHENGDIGRFIRDMADFAESPHNTLNPPNEA